ncbi:conjugal transfer protein TraN [Pokkaliibacter plantistimulans]|uniref:Conjugal transfer protein TraN n=1 Tax=Pokkaliibacter plantistimulans TaxID=1635171 RepID=A0ABX5LU09_9GAMM|nr:conjugal transfer mating pair stabilization protein TraN [Pokkaliibacter plantistimulans]PXF29821.1 conjugal transfer protein TraN [Pokkaliibacter plantistimulans]
MRNQTLFIRTVASLLTVTMSVLPIHAYANSGQNPDISSVGKEAQAFGQDLANSFRANSGSFQNGTISMPALKDGQFHINGGSQINVNDLFPGTSGGDGQSDSYYFPDAKKTDADMLQGLFDSSEDMDDVGNSAKGALWSDANSADPSISGAAYKVLLDATNRSRPNFSNDPMLNQSKDIYENIDLITEGFGDCTVSTSLNKTSFTTHVPEYERCERVTKSVGSCTITHNMGISSFVDTVYVAAKGRTWLTVEFDLTKGTWKTVDPTDGEYSVATIPKLDQVAICGESGSINKTQLVGAWDWIDSGIEGDVDSSVYYQVNQIPSCENGLIGVVQIQDTTESDSDDFVLGGKFEFRFINQKQDSWTPHNCVSDALQLSDGFCTGQLITTGGATNNTDCTTVNGVKICPNDDLYAALTPSPFPSIPTLATEVHLSAMQCNFNVGQMDCWTDPQGVEHCPVNDGKNLSSCQTYENNPQCGFISSACIDGAKGESGQCYVYKDTYDCGSDVEIPTVTKQEEYQCSGEIKCMGDECLDVSKSQSVDFARAVSLLNAAQFMTQDMTCSDSATDEGGDANVDQGCMVFGGKAGTCKIAVGGVQNCCEKPSNISLADYLNLIMAVPKLDGAVMGLQSGNSVKGAYQILREPVLQGWTEITQPFTSYIENISGAVDSFYQPIEQVIDELMDQLTEQVKEVMANIMKGLGQDAATQEAAAGGASKMAQEGMMDSAATWLSTAMTIYTVYVVTMVMIQMLYKCEEEEFTMNAKRALKNCSYVGSYCKSKVLGACVEKREAYCCFNSPLSRIVQEQVRPLLGISFGSAESPQCGGIPLDRVAKIDWSKVNLDEWLGILQQHGKLPDPSSLNLDSLTGAGSDFNIDGSRKNAQERTLERLNGVDVDKARRDLASEIFPDWDGSN